MESAEEGRIITDSAGVLQSRLLFTSLQGSARDPQEISEPSTTRWGRSTMSNWHKSSYSGGSNECPEAREHQTGADVRDTQNRGLGHLSFTYTE